MKYYYILAFSFVMMGSAVFCIFKNTSLFEKYHHEGSKTPNATYSIKLNNHGSIAYVTEQQNDEINRYMFLYLGSFLLSGAGIYIYRRKYPKKPLGHFDL
ncbi:hypothetical protein HYN46_13980 [Aquirhabdus parva]|uniref:Uncharacterized protein n=1 Tax=Aquirhabdus parva TaxID=2283318 RepID=A0A345P987_9GAMM|nr:hypothetical protein HYN46_13980 [Aquirhabdus parva]